MEITKQWIVTEHQHLVQLKSGDFMIGSTTNFYGYENISESDAYALINESN